MRLTQVKNLVDLFHLVGQLDSTKNHDQLMEQTEFISTE